MRNILARDEALEILGGRSRASKEMLMAIKHGYSENVTCSRNVFIPLTRVCRNRCGYCTFKRDANGGSNIMSFEEVMDLVGKAETKGCHEALLTFGESADSDTKVRK